MNKYVLTRFISKYNLNGNVSSVVINSKNDTLSTRFITGDKSLLGELNLDNWTFEDANLGVYDTEQLSKLLDVLSDDIEIKLNPGDMLVYKGCDIEHWRDRFKGENCAQVFLHYNDIDGPFETQNKFDKRPLLGIPK